MVRDYVRHGASESLCRRSQKKYLRTETIAVALVMKFTNPNNLGTSRCAFFGTHLDSLLNGMMRHFRWVPMTVATRLWPPPQSFCRCSGRGCVDVGIPARTAVHAVVRQWRSRVACARSRVFGASRSKARLALSAGFSDSVPQSMGQVQCGRKESGKTVVVPLLAAAHSPARLHLGVVVGPSWLTTA